jgi:hypothetical protein
MIKIEVLGGENFCLFWLKSNNNCQKIFIQKSEKLKFYLHKILIIKLMICELFGSNKIIKIRFYMVKNFAVFSINNRQKFSLKKV